MTKLPSFTSPKTLPRSSKLDSLMRELVLSDRMKTEPDYKKARADFLALIEEVIGPDEGDFERYKNGGGVSFRRVSDEKQKIHNELKAEQRLRKDAL